MASSKKRILINAFLKSQFNCCPLIWVSCNFSLKNEINRLPERCLRIVYSNEKLNFEELWEKYDPVSIHYQNIRFLAIEMFKVFNGISHQIAKEIF